MEDTYQVIVVGAGFAGMTAAKELGRKGVKVLLIDSNNYHQFQPPLYQVATSQIGVSAIARPLRSVFRRFKLVRVVTAEVASVDAANRAVTTVEGDTYRARILVIAAGAVPNFFNTPGAEEPAFPLYSVTDATRLGARLTHLLDAADRETAAPWTSSLSVAVPRAWRPPAPWPKTSSSCCPSTFHLNSQPGAVFTWSTWSRPS